MNRRDFTIGLMLGAAVRQVRSQEKGLAVVGFLSSNAPRTYAAAVGAFRQGLAESGYVEGQNVAIEYRWAEGRIDRLPDLAADLVGRKVDVIATAGGTPAALAAKDATSTIPVRQARPNESLKPTGLMRRDAGATPAMAAGGLARR